MIYTANIAGGAQRAHRSTEVAARRIARNEDGAYGGIEIVRCTGVHAGSEDEIKQRAAEIRERDLGL